MKKVALKKQNWALLCVVGLRPSAPAVAIKTCVDNLGAPQRICLLCTDEVTTRRDIHKPLKTFLFKLKGVNEKSVDIRLIPDRVTDDADDPAPALAREWFDSLGSHVTHKILYADAGLKFRGVTIAMKQGEDVYFAHADGASLSMANRSGSAATFSLSPLGIEWLVALYDLKVTTRNLPISRELRELDPKLTVPPHVVKALSFGIPGVPCFDYAYERGGWLCALSYVSAKKEDTFNLQRIANSLNGLSLNIAICSNLELPRIRARLTAGQTFRAEIAEIQKWLFDGATMPGRGSTIDSTASRDISGILRGSGGDGPSLFVWCGTDPSSTLVALYTHCPRKVWIGVDASSPLAILVAKPFQQVCAEMPFGDAQFVTSDFHGTGLPEKLPIEAVNITPGTAGQRLASVRLALASRALLWSLRTTRGDAKQLGTRITLPLRGPSLEVQLRTCRGDVYRFRPAASGFARSGAMLKLATEFTAEPETEKVVYERAVILGLVLPGQTIGALLEEIVACMFVSAGADEVFVNTEWIFTSGNAKGRPEGEVDVLARFGTVFFAISCKSGSHKAIKEAIREIEARGRVNLGRFAIPVLVRPHIPDDALGKLQVEFSKTALISLLNVSHRGALRDYLDSIIRARRTVPDEFEHDETARTTRASG